jgi:ABC-type transport system involved in cytochrome c biogenesis ATPase subunit
MDAVQISHVTRTFGSVTAVNDLSLAVPQGSIYGFIGPNGSGKTTTMRMIVNIFYPDCGEIRLFGDGRPQNSADLIGYLPEERGLYQKMSVQALLEFYGELRSGRSVKARSGLSWLERLELAGRASDKVETLSKGMSQKVQFIATVIPEPKLLILDEPFSGLDPGERGGHPFRDSGSPPPRRHRDSQHPRHAPGGVHVRLHPDDLSRQEGAGRHSQPRFRTSTARTPSGSPRRAASRRSNAFPESSRSATWDRCRNCG